MTAGHDILAARVFQNPTWIRDAPCAGQGALFYPEQHGNGTRKLTVAGKELWAGCPHRIRCLEYAIDTVELHGIWGGTTPQERRVITRNRRDMGWTTGRHRQIARGVA